MTPYYEQDGIVIYHGDCRDVLPALPVVDLVLTDPPYGIGEHGGKRRFGPASESRGFRSHKNYDDLGWDNEPPSAETLSEVVKLGSKAIVWGANHFISRMPIDSPSWLVWHKKGEDKSDFADCELAWSNLGCAARFIRHDWVGFGAINSGEKRRHPTQKPIPVMSWCIGLAGGINSIADPFMGSGTTLVAAKLAGLCAIGIEREERYCEIAANRLSQGVLFGGAA